MTMPRDLDPYWYIFASEVPSDLGIDMTDEQINALTRALEGAHENYRLNTGLEVADDNWRKENDSKIEKSAYEKVFRFIEDRFRVLDNGPSTMFDYMTHEQRMALAEIMQARNLCK